MAESSQGTPLSESQEVRLESWKEIAAYLKRDVTTVQRWEKREAMPVHRHVHDKRGSVYVLTSELDAWRESRKVRLDEDLERLAPETFTGAGSVPVKRAELSVNRWFALAAVACLGLLAVAYLVLRARKGDVARPKITALAVLPLRNLSGDPGQEYLAEGITEALIARLSEIHDLHVIPHTSVMRFQNTQIAVPEIAKALGVQALVEGSVMRTGNRIRVTARLIRGATEQQLWSETYDRELQDALALESELAQAIAGKIQVTVTGAEQQRLTQAHPIAPEVYESYLKGRFVLNKSNSKAGIEESIGYFQEAIAKEPTFAAAYVGLAEAYSELGTVFVGVAPTETRPKAIAAAQKALELDPNIAAAHVILGDMLQDEWHWAAAEGEFRRALELNPKSGSANAAFAQWLLCQGRTEEAVSRVRLARELDPVAISGDNVSWILFQSHRYEESIRESRSTVAVDPEDASVLLGLGFALIANHEATEAIPVLEKALARSDGSAAVSGVLIRAYAHAGRRSDAIRLLKQLEERQKTEYVPAGAFVNAYLGLDEKEQAFGALEQAYKERSNILQFLKTHPYFDPIRNDPRFADLLRRVGLS